MQLKGLGGPYLLRSTALQLLDLHRELEVGLLQFGHLLLGARLH